MAIGDIIDLFYLVDRMCLSGKDINISNGLHFLLIYWSDHNIPPI